MKSTAFDNSLFSAGSSSANGLGLDGLAQASDGAFDSKIRGQDISKPRRRSKHISRQEVAEVTSQLAIMIRSGVDISSALSSLAAQCQRPALAGVLTSIRDSVLSGNALSEALKCHPEVFAPSFVATVSAGEASGRMSEVLQQLSEVQKREIQRLREMRALMIYPVLLMAVSTLVLAGLIVFVLPRFTQIFAQYEMPLPVLTELLMAVADLLRSHWWLWLLLGLAGGIALLVWRKSAHGRTRLDRLWLQLPFIEAITRNMYTGTVCRVLGLMLENGVTLLESLPLTRQAVGNTLFKQLLTDLEQAVLNGQSLGSVLRLHPYVPSSAKEMIITAERTGKLNEVTAMLGEYYEHEAEEKLRQFIALMEPLITVVMGAIVAVVVLSVMLPVFNLSSYTSGGP